MKRLHISILFLFGWFFAFYNIERIFEQVNLASFAYLLAPLLGISVLSLSQLRQIHVAWYVPISVISVMFLRAAFGYSPDGNAFALTITESLATWITIALSHQLGRGIDEYHSAAATAMVSHLSERILSLEEAESTIVGEVRRARLFRRPIAVLALNPDVVNQEETLDRFTQEFKSGLVQRYVSARAAECLNDRLRSCDILTQTNEQFLALLPEMSRDEALALAADMRTHLNNELGIDLRVGISMFPEDEVTAIGLIERAEAEVDALHAAAGSAAANLDVGNILNLAQKNDHVHVRNEGREAETFAP